ncbi:TRAP transporter large permease [Iodobacter fluviatilis]|uniref:TRAP transporter large permease protein n=1 Tax=Iodobacter fluviatilis TaxID=537 RepID=A0A377SUB6_9NEIS|nr:TRAP transporter large permease subunit [Iodobacter fluviatilis]TCU85622.1 C4-dicarboxylate transporter DctM subunit [Iodobacter fluviatilis]STR44930.1 Neu5Ac permease [Iodobacter fluviatilis]
MSTIPAPEAHWSIKIPALVFGSLAIIAIVGGKKAVVFCLLLALMATGMPISIALGLTVLTFLFTMTNVPIESVALKLFTGIEKFEIMAIPFFILAGNFLTHGGVARRMIDFATSMVGHFHGGLGLAGVLACALFAAVSGSSPATVVAIGSILLPAMIKQGFPRQFGAGVITTAGALGILIPPSIAMVMFSVATNTSVGALFMAGVIPGLMLAFFLGLTTWWRARKFGYPRMPKATAGERWGAFRRSVWGLMLIVLVLGGIYTGVFTPTEAAAIAAVYAFIIAVFVYRDLPLSRVPKVLLDSASMSAMLLYIITNAVLFSFVMTNEGIPQAMADWLLGMGLGPITFLLAVNILLLLAGNVMEPSSIILIMAPILFPVAVKLGINPIHFGILITVNMEVGMCHPPVGLNLYVASGITKMGITELTVAVWPWLLTMLGFLLLITYVPAISLWLPTAMGMM